MNKLYSRQVDSQIFPDIGKLKWKWANKWASGKRKFLRVPLLVPNATYLLVAFLANTQTFPVSQSKSTKKFRVCWCWCVKFITIENRSIGFSFTYLAMSMISFDVLYPQPFSPISFDLNVPPQRIFCCYNFLLQFLSNLFLITRICTTCSRQHSFEYLW